MVILRFYDREQELDALEKVDSRTGSDFVAISGRRRIGKSRLLEEFVKGKNVVSILVVPKEERQVAKDIEEAIRSKLGYSPAFASVRDALEYLLEQEVGLVWIDEFPNMLVANPAIPSELQILWEKYKDAKETLFIVSGSCGAMMDRIFSVTDAPLLNQVTVTMNLRPLSFRTVIELLNDLGVNSPQQQISFYCLFDGIPYYYILLERIGDRSIEGAVQSLFYDTCAQLSEEGDSILRQEFGNAFVKFYAILGAIGGGSASMSEISQTVGLKPAGLAKYLNALQHDFKFVGKDVPFGEDPTKSKQGVYYIKDNMLAFWFSSVYGKKLAPGKEELNSFIGKRFEILCREFLSAYLQSKGKTVLHAGRWWGQVNIGEGKLEQREIHLVVETEKALYLGECKWTSQKAGEQDLKRLIESSEAFSGAGRAGEKPVRFVLFSKEGFESMTSGEAMLFDSDMITKGS